MLSLFQFVGTIDNPLQKLSGSGYGGIEDKNNGPITFISNVFMLVALAAGLFALTNLVMAGMKYISSSGDPQIVEAAQKQLTMSLIGIIIIIMSYVIASLVGWLLFGDASFLFTPEIYGPGAGTF